MAGELELPDFQPGTNGLKYSQVTGRVYYTSTQQKLFCQVGVDEKTLEPDGEVEVVARGMQGDDLIVDDSESAKPVAFVTTHRDNTVHRIPLDSKDSGRTDGKMSVFLEGTESDEQMLGPTDGSWAHGQVGKRAYFTTDGGLKNMVGGFVKCAKVVRVEF